MTMAVRALDADVPFLVLSGAFQQAPGNSITLPLSPQLTNFLCLQAKLQEELGYPVSHRGCSIGRKQYPSLESPGSPEMSYAIPDFEGEKKRH